MDQSLPLYRQLSSQFILLAISFFLLILLGLALYFPYQQELTQLKSQQFPAVEKFSQQQQLLIKNERLINQILASKNAEKFDDYYQGLIENLKEISTLSRKNRRMFEELNYRLAAQAQNVSRSVASHSRNAQLKESVIIQLTLVESSLGNLIAEQKKQLQTLDRQLKPSNLTAQSAVAKAKALSLLVNNLNNNVELQLSLLDTLMMFNQLDLQYGLVEFNYIQEKVQREVSYWLINFSNLDGRSSIEKALFEQITVLKALLFDEQKTFANWRGQLRRVNDFYAELKQQKIDLVPLVNKEFTAVKVKPNFIEEQFISWSKSANVTFQPQYIVWFFIVIFALITMVFVSLLMNLRNKIKYFGEQSIIAVEEFIDNGEVLANPPGHEVSAMVTKMQELTRPVHTEADFQRQLQKYLITVDLMSRHTATSSWQFPDLSTHEQLSVILGFKEIKQHHWRHNFSRDDVRAILTCARQAKANGNIERINLLSSQGKALVLTIEYINNTWCGSLSNIEENQALKDECEQLQQQLQQQVQTEKREIISSCDAISAKVTKAILHHQMLSLQGDYDRDAFQHLRQLVAWTEQQQISSKLRLDDFVLSLSTVKLANEIHTALANVSFHQSYRHNSIHLSFDDKLAPLVTIESELFQSLINTLCHKLLAEQRGAELQVSLKVIDVNSAQQIVRMNFIVVKPLKPKMLSDVINELTYENTINNNTSNVEARYLNDLQLVFNVSNKTSEPMESGYKFAFDMPIAVAIERKNGEQQLPSKLPDCKLLIIATDKSSRERIYNQLAKIDAKVETMHDLTLFQRQINVKHLTKHPIDAIILSAEVYCSDYELIAGHLASLPKAIQPKVLVLQPFNSSKLQKAGLFSASDKPWFSGDLITHIEPLLHGKTKDNLLIEPEIFSTYRYARTQVEVLMGLSQLNENQALIRILHWLGLQVTVVSQPANLERLWQSGRYLIVITEFTFLKHKIKDTDDIVRGVFKLSNHNDKQSFISKSGFPKSWRTGYLAPTLDIQKITQQLSPWLKQEHSINEKQVNKHNLTVNLPDNAGVDSRVNITNTVVEYSLDQVLDQPKAIKTIKAAFDLTQYAQNQGSAELAAFMIDDYIADIHVHVSTLERALDEKNYLLVDRSLQSLILLANVISAKDLLNHCRQLSLLTNNTSANNGLSEKQKEKLPSQLLKLKLCLEQLTEFAESI